MHRAISTLTSFCRSFDFRWFHKRRSTLRTFPFSGVNKPSGDTKQRRGRLGRTTPHSHSRRGGSIRVHSAHLPLRQNPNPNPARRAGGATPAKIALAFLAGANFRQGAPPRRLSVGDLHECSPFSLNRNRTTKTKCNFQWVQQHRGE